MIKDAGFHQRHPYLFVILVQLTVISALGVTGFIMAKLGADSTIMYGAALVVGSAIGIGVLTRMKWWQVVGFKRLKEYHLIWLPAIPIVVNIIKYYEAIPLIPLDMLIKIFIITALSGFMEETFFRGIMLRALMPKGVWRAALITSFLFSISHILNAAAGWNIEALIWQFIYSFAIGFGYAGFAVRTGTIWPLAVTHFLNNFTSLAKQTEIIAEQGVSISGHIMNSIYTIAFIVYGILLIKSYFRDRSINRQKTKNIRPDENIQ